jgi:hypothetical protein
MISLLLGLSLLNATDGKELISCKLMDEFWDYKATCTEQQEKVYPEMDNDEDALYIELEGVEFLPNDIESICDFTVE